MRPQRSNSTRCMISHRPPYRTGEPIFYRCALCGDLVARVAPEGAPAPAFRCSCCGTAMERLIPQTPDPDHAMTYLSFGGFEHNAVRVEVDRGGHPMTRDHRIEWLYLRTYQGGQLKYLPAPGPSEAVFAMAGEDAYCYCDREVCRMGQEPCQFQCKRGHTAYAYCSQHGLYFLRF